MSNLISNNSDFLFIYEAIQCNPNGDPDQENKPRMDYDTNTNLVTDTRVKRYIRDYVKQEGNEIFVDMVSESKVTMDKRLEGILEQLWDNPEQMQLLIDDDKLTKDYEELKGKDFKATLKKLNDSKDKAVPFAILTGLVKKKFLDIRLFGSAFAVGGFNKPFTGPVQMNWGYSFNKVYLMDSPTITSIMNDGNSTFGKDYRVKYSLLGFHGTINKAAAVSTGMTEHDHETFQKAIWDSLSANPTRTKLNQYPKLYLEIIYNDGYSNGQFGDLRGYVKSLPRKIKEGKEERIDEREVRNFGDLDLDFTELTQLINEFKVKGGAIKDVVVKSSPDMKKKLTYGNH